MAIGQNLGAINLAGAASTLALGDCGSGKAGIVTIQVVGSITATITVQASVDGATWVSTLARSTGSTTSASTITAAGIYHIEGTNLNLRLSWPGSETGTPVIWRDAAIG